MSTRSLRTLVAGALLVAALVAPGAFAGKPTIERFDIDETFADDFLTDACGVPVTTTAKGHVIVRTFSGGGKGVAEVRTLNVAYVARSGDNAYRFRDVGADHLQVKPDGTEILMIIGQIPFGIDDDPQGFTGVLKINLTTGEVILQPQHGIGGTEEACAALTA
ncbi:MAG TPA: hypothetical protein VD769_03735 [Gaiellaceae bacterium]|nr:hypothetical protein [Gaiellaceae bacterium]